MCYLGAWPNWLEWTRLGHEGAPDHFNEPLFDANTKHSPLSLSLNLSQSFLILIPPPLEAAAEPPQLRPASSGFPSWNDLVRAAVH